MLKLKNFFLIIFLLFLFISIYADKDSNKSEQFFYTYLNFSFKSSVKLPVFEEIGTRNNRNEVVEYSIPDKTDERKRAKLRLVLFRIPKGLKDGPLAETASLVEKLTYCNSVYLGAGPAKLVKKRIHNGKEIIGHMNRSSIPRKGLKESFILKINDDIEIFVGFFYLDTYSIKNINNIIRTIIDSISISKKVEPHTQFLSSFKDKYRTTSEIKKGNSLKAPRLDPAGLKNLKIYRLKAKDQIKGKKGFYLQFRLSVYMYNDSGQSKIAFSKYKIKEQEVKDSMRSKSQLLSLLKDNYIFILDGSCLFSRKNMAAIEKKLIEIIFQKIQPDKNLVLKKICGGLFN